VISLEEALTKFEAVIGLEVHAQLLTKTKMFCACPITYGAAPNTQICPVCLGLPGALPVPNKHAITLAMRAGLSLGCSIRGFSRFARKNYFYPDLSKGYQISQFDLPLNEKGALEITTSAGTKTIGITRIHVEEDAAKNLHGMGLGEDTLVDFNRAGTALIETVSEPDMRTADEAEAYLKALRDIFMFAGINDGNLEEGSFRCDANVSIRPIGQEKFGTRAELKNINSFRFVKKGIEYEIARQAEILLGGGKVIQETRTWSSTQEKTISMRTKEEAHDYRYFADPDLPPLEISDAWLAEVKGSMPEPLQARRQRWQSELGLTAYDAMVISSHPRIADYFEEATESLVASSKLALNVAGPSSSVSLAGPSLSVSLAGPSLSVSLAGPSSSVSLAGLSSSVSPAGLSLPVSLAGKKTANFILSEVLRFATTSGLEAQFPCSASRLADLLALVEDETINGKIAKDVFAEMVTSGKAPKVIIDQKGLAQVKDTGAIEASIREVLTKHPKELASFKAGKVTLKGFFVGQVMRALKGANPKLLNDTLDAILAEP